LWLSIDKNKNGFRMVAFNWLRMLDNPDILFRFDVVEVIITDDSKPRWN
jgi:hypothetical protein